MSSDRETAGFSEREWRVLASVLDEIIPPRDDGMLPGAGELGIVRYIDEALQDLPDLRSMIAQGLSDLDEIARGRNAGGFDDLPREQKVQLLHEQAFVFPLTLHTFLGYYQSPRVAEALGLEARPPHPDGYPVEESDLTLLDPVRRRPKLYREC